MNISDFMLPFLGICIVYNSFYHAVKNGWKRKETIDLILGFFVFGFSLWLANDNSEKMETLTKSSKSLSYQINLLSDQVKTDSISN